MSNNIYLNMDEIFLLLLLNNAYLSEQDFLSEEKISYWSRFLTNVNNEDIFDKV